MMPNKEPLPNPWARGNQRPASQSQVEEGLYPQQQVYVQLGDRQVPVQELTAGQLALYQCCPCCVGDPCSPQRRKEYFRLYTQTFLGIVTIIEVIYFIVELAMGGVTSLSINPFIGPGTIALLTLGAKSAYLIGFKYQVYRLLLSCFMHSGFIHIILNLYTQILTGFTLEKLWGTKVVAAMYLIGGIGGNILSCLIFPNAVGVGASGALCSLIGGMVAHLYCTWASTHPLQRRVMLVSLSISVGIMALFSFMPFIDGGAHLGGFICGILIGLFAFIPLKYADLPRPTESHVVKMTRRIVVLALVVYFVLFGVLIFTVNNPVPFTY